METDLKVNQRSEPAGTRRITVDSSSTATSSADMMTISAPAVLQTATPHGVSTTSAGTNVSSQGLAPKTLRSAESIRNAVYAYLQAMRGLGRTRVNTAEVARALGISVELVNTAIASLTDKGVKVA